MMSAHAAAGAPAAPAAPDVAPIAAADAAPGASPVVVSLRSLTANSLPLETLSDAFGPSSLGIILVKDLPPQFSTLRSKLLQYASYLAHLPADELARVTVPEAKYLTGWSHGVETLRSGRKDELKGSWYSNCTFYHDHGSAVRVGSAAGQSLDAKIADMALAEAELEHNSPPKDGGLGAVAAGGGGMPGLRKESSSSGGSPDPADFPEYTSPNVWPSEDLLPGFQKTLENLCCLIIDVAILVARQCDRFATTTGIEGYVPGYLERVVSTSKTTKARLLHYFPPPPPLSASTSGEHTNGTNGSDITNGTNGVNGVNGTNGHSTSHAKDARAAAGEDDDDDDWCTIHKDHGCLTGLTSALFVDESDPEPLLAQDKDGSVPASDADADFALPPLRVLKASPDPAAGLYIRDRTGALTRVAIPADCLAFQTGEALERVTKGQFAAVPHFVRGPRLGSGSGGGGGAGAGAGGVAARVARNTLAVFTQPNLGDKVDDRGTTFADFAREIVARNTVETA